MEFPLPLSSLNKFESHTLKIDLFFVVQYAYGKFKRHDCTPGNDLHSMAAGGTEEIHCRGWCNNNPNCGAMPVEVISKEYITVQLFT